MSESWVPYVEEGLKQYLSRVEEILNSRDLVREELIKTGREVVRMSGYVVTNIHTDRWGEVEANLSRLMGSYRKLRETLKRHPCYEYSNLVVDLVSEYVEALVLYHLVRNHRLATPEELEVDHVPYLLGLLEVVGELKRYVLKLLSEERLEEAQEFFNVMEVIYEHLQHLDYPDAVLPNVRRKVDIARGVTESLRSFVTDVMLRYKLVRKC
ncbi:MAG: haloacid dehalogenase [Zestosphaera sp.]